MLLKKSFKFLAVILFLLLIISPAFAAEKSFKGTSSCIIPINNNDVQLVSQKVFLRVMENETFKPDYLRNILVDAEYTLLNTGKSSTVEMGLPFPKDLNGLVKPWNFEVVVGKKAVKFEEKDIQIGKYRTWFTWKANIPQGETENIILRYRIAPSSIVSDGKKEPFYFSSYIQKPGKLWKGVIEDSSVTLDFAPKYIDINHAYPGGLITRYGQLIWKFKDREPGENIFYEIWTTNTMFSLLKRILKPGDLEVINASSFRVPQEKYSPVFAFDGNTITCWRSGTNNGDKKKWIAITSRSDNEFWIEKIGFVNGNGEITDSFFQYDRAKKIELVFSDGSGKEIMLKDMKEAQWFNIKPPIKTSSIKFIIKSVYRGSLFHDVCISDIMLRGTHSLFNRKTLKQYH